MKRFGSIVALCALWFSSGQFLFAEDNEGGAAYVADREMGFLWKYSFLNFDESVATKRQSFYLGVDMDYRWFPWRVLGFGADIGFWYVPIRVENAQDTNFVAGTVLAAVTGRPIPETYFDPRFSVLSGALFTSSGRLGKDSNLVVGGKLSVNLFRDLSLFADQSLAFVASASFYQILGSAPEVIDSNFYEAGLGLRGSF